MEGKNQQMEQRDQRIERLEKDLATAKAEISEKNEQVSCICGRKKVLFSTKQAGSTSLPSTDRFFSCIDTVIIKKNWRSVSFTRQWASVFTSIQLNTGFCSFFECLQSLWTSSDLVSYRLLIF